MEFVQFYPTCMGSGSPAVFYECVLLEAGGRLLNSEGEDIAVKHGLNDGMLLTRDRLSRAVGLELADGLGMDGGVVLDLTDVSPDSMDMLQSILPKEVWRGERRCHVAPAVHFHMGGVKINERAETSMHGLYAAGEVCAGVHGANRLSGNALTELWVFGAIAGREAARRAKEGQRALLPSDAIATESERLQRLASGGNGKAMEELRRLLKETMWRKAGIIRDDLGLSQGLEEIADLKERFDGVSVSGGRELQRAVKLGSMLTSAEMVCRAALYRRESRGAHYRQDHSEQNDRDWLCNVLLTNKGGHMAMSTEPVGLNRVQP
jgi:succinate dehydrogenase/fumarate reductase flavoprotein subunit